MPGWGARRCPEAGGVRGSAPGSATPLREAPGSGLTRKFETIHVGGATCRTPPIPRSALEKDYRYLKESNFRANYLGIT